MGENFKEKNNEVAEAKAEGNNAVLNGNESEATPQKLTDEQKYAKKYLFMREKLLKNYDIGCKKYRKAKITTVIIFLVISVLFTVLSISTGRHMQFLTVWIILIFFLVTVYLFLDYIRYLIEDKVIPYLKDDDMLEYGEYDIFTDNDDDEDEIDDEEEDE